jgi:hypothetical protein
MYLACKGAPTVGLGAIIFPLFTDEETEHREVG